ncbi:MAG: 2-amino-4-hydroxy-6-hydroxymethyldihydropteridine diphosphokinase [Victivallales bacterium]|nr:2-amino-4-hydroxy-6-hydroxymethyldihydropteridine diphosphokinase [Victivallales bacterium]
MDGMLLLISLGTNCGGPGKLAEAIEALREAFSEVVATVPEETAPLEGTGPSYFNCVAMARTMLSPQEVKRCLREIEGRLGRERSTPAVVAIDLDLLLYGNLVDATLKLPSPDLVERPFCLQPAVELAPDFIHPILKISLKNLAQQRKTT